VSGMTWWQCGIIYQIYPRSFQDSDGDGVGDLAGIVERLDYPAWLGVDAIWLSPIYPSPMADFGYDVSDYCAIDPAFGTLAQFDRLVAEAHARGLRLILDFVPNHTSDQHPWFLESRSSRASARRDWYIWCDAASGAPPNNWLSHFGGGAWEWDAVTGQYYLHSFLKEQPDLNWRNPEVRRAMYAALRFWLDRGVDGFRVDVLWLLIKDDQLRDNPPNPAWRPGDRSHGQLLPVHDADQPEVHEVVAEMRRVLDAYPGERVLIGEIYLPLERLVTYYGQDRRGADLPFNFQLLLMRWDAGEIASVIKRYEALLPPGAWPNWVLGNHDRSRLASRIGPAQARVAAMLLLTLRGTPTIYYGEEIGMQDVPISSALVADPAEKNEPGLGLGRDPERTPMPWDESPSGGFTSGGPWLPLGPDHRTRNVAVLSGDPASILSLYRALTALRRRSEALTAGSIAAVAADHGVLAYQRHAPGETLHIFLNLGAELRDAPAPAGRVILSTHLDRGGEAVVDAVRLRPAEGVIVGAAPNRGSRDQLDPQVSAQSGA